MTPNTHYTFSIVLSALFVGLLASCGPSNPDNTAEPSSSETQSTQSDSSQTETSSEPSDNTNATSTKPTLVYYQMPGWQFCKKVTSIVDGMKDDYKNDLNFEIVSTQSERGQTEPEEYDLGRHGMVILNKDGDGILWKKKGHKISKEDIQTGIQKSLN